MNHWISGGQFHTRSTFLGVGLLMVLSLQAQPSEERWWPLQSLPKSVVRTPNQQEFASPRAALEMMVQSIAGLAAKAVNEGQGDELVWVDNGNPDLEDWYVRFFAAHPSLHQPGVLGPWDLVDRYAKRGLIKGYILYRSDSSLGQINTYRPGMDCSVNVATSLAGLLDGIIVDEELEKTAQAYGLARLLDARGKSQAWCFESYLTQFQRAMLCTQDPKKPHVRDLAIAQKAFTVYGKEAPTPAVMAWLDPLSPILGWNGGDEFASTDLSTRFGHIQTATDWCMNLPVLMAGAEKTGRQPKKGLRPHLDRLERPTQRSEFLSKPTATTCSGFRETSSGVTRLIGAILTAAKFRSVGPAVSLNWRSCARRRLIMRWPLVRPGIHSLNGAGGTITPIVSASTGRIDGTCSPGRPSGPGPS